MSVAFPRRRIHPGQGFLDEYDLLCELDNDPTVDDVKLMIKDCCKPTITHFHALAVEDKWHCLATLLTHPEADRHDAAIVIQRYADTIEPYKLTNNILRWDRGGRRSYVTQLTPLCQAILRDQTDLALGLLKLGVSRYEESPLYCGMFGFKSPIQIAERSKNWRVVAALGDTMKVPLLSSRPEDV
jgi:hypothetical protein